MPARVSPTERIRGEIDALFAEDRDLSEVLEDVARLGARLILQTAVEAEVTEFLGRDRYARGDRARPGHRNGYSNVTVKTTAAGGQDAGGGVPTVSGVLAVATEGADMTADASRGLRA
ncbi:MAG TPA: transposase [Euzebyales bacterium]|nr:transposase [Euzebyales bacterium]